MNKLSELILSKLVRCKSILKGTLITFGVVGLLATLILFFIKAKPIVFAPVFILPVTWQPLLLSVESVTEEIQKHESEITKTYNLYIEFHDKLPKL